MSETVDDLRNEIRRAVGRFERPASTAFTKESLAAICEAVGHEVDGNELPPTSEMRAAILRQIDAADEDETDAVERNFRKAELAAIAEALREV